MKKETKTNIESAIIVLICFLATALLQDEIFK
jgi:hypothetical protein